MLQPSWAPRYREKARCFVITPPSLPGTTASLPCAPLKMSSAARVVPFKAQLRASFSCIGLETLKCGSRLSGSSLARLLFLTRFCGEGAGHGDCRCRLWTRERANRWWHLANCEQNVWGEVAVWVFLYVDSSPSSVMCICARTAVKESTSAVLGQHPEGQLQWEWGVRPRKI